MAPQLVQVQRFEQIVVGSVPHRLDGRVRRLGSGDEDHGNACVDPANRLVNLQAGLIGKVKVEKYDIGRIGADIFKPCHAAAGHLDAMRGGGEREA